MRRSVAVALTSASHWTPLARPSMCAAAMVGMTGSRALANAAVPAWGQNTPLVAPSSLASLVVGQNDPLRDLVNTVMVEDPLLERSMLLDNLLKKR